MRVAMKAITRTAWVGGAAALLIACAAAPSRADVAVPATEPTQIPATQAATQPSHVIPMRPEVLPGAGLAEHSFLYTGEWDYRFPMQTMFLVRGGYVLFR